ncbi:hypothetical protein, partial [Erythrobacter sp. HI0063]|uniref:hypothetical protein n=1 Tax=Erythrobacter sp. HI0063 TaxID=1822240 RepID=UPI0018D39DC9
MFGLSLGFSRPTFRISDAQSCAPIYISSNGAHHARKLVHHKIARFGQNIHQFRADFVRYLERGHRGLGFTPVLPVA